MATVLIANGATAANSADIVLADGATATLAICGPSGATPVGAKYVVQFKRADASYQDMWMITTDDMGRVIAGDGTWRVRRDPNGITSSLEQG